MMRNAKKIDPKRTRGTMARRKSRSALGSSISDMCLWEQMCAHNRKKGTEIPDEFTTQNHEDGYVDSQESVTGQENNTPSVRTAEPQPIVERPDIDDIFHRIVGDDDDVEDRIPLWMIEVAPLIKIAGNIDVQADFDTILERIIEKLGSDAGSFSKTPTAVDEWPTDEPDLSELDEEFIARKVKRLMKDGSATKIIRTLESKGLADHTYTVPPSEPISRESSLPSSLTKKSPNHAPWPAHWSTSAQKDTSGNISKACH
jgi:hypothetical protein